MESLFEYQIVGIIVVFSCLVFLSFMLAFSGKIASRLNDRAKAKAAAKTQPAAQPRQVATTTAQPNTGITPELIAAISAAVHTVLEGQSHRIIDIRQSAESAYSLSGRTEIFASHRIRPTSR